MTIYERERDGRPINPALALYKFWHSVLTGLAPEVRNNEGRLIGTVRLTVDGGWDGISFVDEGPKNRPTISGPGIHLRHNGEFKMFPHHGYQQRRRTSRNTFLGWTHWRSGYNWFVDTSPESTGYRPWSWEFGGAVSDWRQPRHYVHEGVLGMRQRYWDSNRPVLKLEWSDEFGWHIAFSRTGPPNKYSTRPPITQEDFDRFEALRQRRYALLERHAKLMDGELIREGHRIITAEERQERRDEAVQVIMANLTVSQPARTVPLRRDREEEGQWLLPLGCQ